MFIGVNGIEGHLDFRGHHAGVDLGNQNGSIRREGRDVGLTQFQRVHQGQARVWIQTKRGKNRLEEG